MSGENTYGEILISGAFAAFTIDLLVYPLDTIKTRLQSQDYIKTYASSPAPATASSVSATTATAALQRARPSPYALRGLYQGVGSVVIATLPASGVFFSTYESAKHVIGQILPRARDGSKAPPAALVNSLSSGIAELASCLVLTPAEVIKQNAQMIQAGTAAGKTSRKTSVLKPSMSSSLQALDMLRKAEGGAARRLWSGYSALVARNLPFTALQFPMFEAMRKRLLNKWAGGNDPNTAPVNSMRQLLLIGAVNGLSAGSSGAVAAVVTTPTDVVKTRMMLSPSALSAASSELSTQNSSHGSNRDAPDNKSGAKSSTQLTRHTAKEAGPRRMNGLQLARLIYREHGIQGLFRGGAFRAAWTFVGSGLYLGTYEMTKTWLRVRREAEEQELRL